MFNRYSINPEIALMYLARIIAFLTAIPLHETAHAYVSYKLGDPTAKELGRISLNPVKHFDILGALFMLLVGFGWAKPVPINTRFYANKKMSMALSSFAGPLSNFIFAFFLMIVYKIIYVVYLVHSTSTILYCVLVVFQYMISINISLTVFNMLPIPPLDGSRMFLIFLPEKTYFGIMRYERYIMLGLFLAVSSGVLNGILNRLQIAIYTLLANATVFVDIFFR